MIKEIKITSVEIHGFKGIEDFGVELNSDYNLFLADNGKGKTSFKEAIFWAFTGDVLEKGVNGADIIHSKKEQAVVIVYFTDENGILHKVERVRNNKGYDLKFDEAKIKQVEFSNIVDKEALCLSDPLFFLSLPPDQARKYLISRLPQITEDDVRGRISEHHTEISSFDNIPKQMKALREELKSNTESQISREGQIEGLKMNLKEIKLRKKKDVYAEKIENLLNQTSEKTNLAKEIKSVKDMIETEKKVVFQDIFNEDKEKQAIAYLRQTYVKESNNVKVFTEDVSKFELVYKETQAYIEKHSKATNCPVCGAAVTNETEKNIKKYLEKTLKKRLEQEKNNLVLAQERLAKSQDLMNKALEEGKIKKEEFLKKQEENNAKKKIFLEEQNKKIEILVKKLKELEEQYEKLDLSKIEKEIETLKAKQFEILNFNASLEKEIKLQANYRDQINKIMKQIQVTNQRNQQIELHLSIFKEFILKRVELINNEIKKYLKNTSIILEKINTETGEVKEVFEIMYLNNKGILKEINLCSTSERIKAGLEIIDMLKKLTGINYTILIDNAESIVNYERPENQQIIELRVEEGLSLGKIDDDALDAYKKKKAKLLKDVFK